MTIWKSCFFRQKERRTVISLALLAFVQTSVASTGAASYSEAHKTMTQTGRPIVVLVGADWCPGCRVMKTTAMPQVQQQGGLERVAFATVNTDHEPTLARELMGGGSIPQLIMYYQTAAGWQRRVMVGAQSPAAIQQFINQSVTTPAPSALGRR
ncbi:MAG TPA: thioredoxin family protein [Pirellulales bacterium]|nr:thioredoxin family protein [Pirellulales bacterium]